MKNLILATAAMALMTGCTATSQDLMALSGFSRTCAVMSANNGDYHAASANSYMADVYESLALFQQQQEHMELQRQQLEAFYQAQAQAAAEAQAQAEAAAQAEAQTNPYEYGTPVAGKPGFVLSPYAPSAGLVDVRDPASGQSYPRGTQVRCPYTSEIFLVP